MNFIACLPFELASGSVVLTGTTSTPTYMAAQNLTTFALFAMIIQLRQGGWSMVLFFGLYAKYCNITTGNTILFYFIMPFHHVPNIYIPTLMAWHHAPITIIDRLSCISHSSFRRKVRIFWKGHKIYEL